MILNNEMLQWLYENVGKEGIDWQVKTKFFPDTTDVMSDHLVLKNPAHITLFLLKWGST